MNIDMDNLLKENINLIRKLAYKYSNYSCYEDLMQVGKIGLYNAYLNFDKTKGTKFSTFAYTYIWGEMVRLVNSDRNIKVSSDYLKLYKSYLKSKEFLSQKLNKEPSLNEISLFMEVEEKTLEDSILACEFVMSLDNEPMEELNLYEVIGENEKGMDEDILMVREEVEKLSSPDKEIITLRYYQDKTQSEVAKVLNMNQTQVSRYEKRALSRIRSNFYVA